MSDKFKIRNGLKQVDALWPYLFKCALDNAIRRFQVIQDAWILNGTHQLLVYGDDVTILGVSVHTVKENGEAFW
jgi:hypothetical protein